MMKKGADRRPFNGGPSWDRTSDLSSVNGTLFH